MDWRFHASIQFRLSLACIALSLCLARMIVVEGTLLERSEWIRSFCHLGSPTDRYRMEKRGENSEVTLRTYAFLTRAYAPLTYDIRTLKICALIRGYALNSGVRLLTRLYGTGSVSPSIHFAGLLTPFIFRKTFDVG